MIIKKQELGTIGSYGYLHIITKVGVISYHYQQGLITEIEGEAGFDYDIKDGRDIYKKLTDVEKEEIYDLINETLIQ